MGHKRFHSMIRPSWKAIQMGDGMVSKYKLLNAKLSSRELRWLYKKGEAYESFMIR